MNSINTKLLLSLIISLYFSPLISVHFVNDYIKNPFAALNSSYLSQNTLTASKSYAIGATALVGVLGAVYALHRTITYLNDCCFNKKSDQYIIKYAHAIHYKFSRQFSVLLNHIDAYDLTNPHTTQQKIIFKNALLQRSTALFPFLEAVNEIKTALIVITQTISILERRITSVKSTVTDATLKNGTHADCIVILTALKTSLQKLNTKLERLKNEITSCYEYKMELRENNTRNQLFLNAILASAAIGALVW